LSGKEVERQEWIKNDIDRVNHAITLLNSPDISHVNEGMEMVGNILPFLLIGGFSKSEVIAYLKAKMEARHPSMILGASLSTLLRVNLVKMEAGILISKVLYEYNKRVIGFRWGRWYGKRVWLRVVNFPKTKTKTIQAAPTPTKPYLC